MLDFFNAHANKIAFITILLLTILALVGSFKDKGRLAKYAKQSPALLTTIGVFFSFCGILIALQHFDVDSKDSIKGLLEGLKIKFASSLMGIGASIIVKIAQSFKLENDKQLVDSDQKIIDLLQKINQLLAENKQNTSEQLFTELKKSIDVLPQEFKKQSGLLENIKSSLAGEGDASVTTQLIKMRIEIKDCLSESDKNNKNYLKEMQQETNKGFTVLINEFRSFADKMADNNSKALIEALENVMRDFNTKINEQFGENFKELNRAVGELLKWQDNYKAQVETLTDNFKIALESVQTIQTAFGDIQTRSENFANTSEKLHGILESLDRQLKDLDNHLKAFDSLANNANNAFPIIRDNLNDLTIGFKESTQESLNDINNTVSDMSHKLNNATTKFEKMAEAIKQSVDTHDKNLTAAVNKQLDSITNSIGDANREFNRFLTDNTTNTSKILEQQVSKLDDALQKELIKSMEIMGKQLATLSNQFVQDYRPLTEQLRKVVRLAEDLKRERN